MRARVLALSWTAVGCDPAGELRICEYRFWYDCVEILRLSETNVCGSTFGCTCFLLSSFILGGGGGVGRLESRLRFEISDTKNFDQTGCVNYRFRIECVDYLVEFFVPLKEVARARRSQDLLFLATGP